MHKWCMCTEIKEISKVGHYTSKRCKTCGGADPYGVSQVRRISKDKKVVTSSTATVDGVPEHVVAAYEAITSLCDQIDSADELSKKNIQQRAMWEGKFHQLRRENNALRRKLHRKEKEEKEEEEQDAPAPVEVRYSTTAGGLAVTPCPYLIKEGKDVNVGSLYCLSCNFRVSRFSDAPDGNSVLCSYEMCKGTKLEYTNNQDSGRVNESCPYGLKPRIGSVSCSECKYCLRRDLDKQYILCSKAVRDHEEV